jgi:hypothetical protein
VRTHTILFYPTNLSFTQVTGRKLLGSLATEPTGTEAVKAANSGNARGNAGTELSGQSVTGEAGVAVRRRQDVSLGLITYGTRLSKPNKHD